MRFQGFKRLDEDRMDGAPWWEEAGAGCADMIEDFCVRTPFGIVLMQEIFDRRGRPVEKLREAYGFEGVVVAGPEEGIWVEGCVDDVYPVRLQ